MPCNRFHSARSSLAAVFALALAMAASAQAGCAEPGLPIGDARDELVKEIGTDTLVWGTLDSLKSFSYVAGVDYSYRSTETGKPAQQGRRVMLMGVPTIQVATYYLTVFRNDLVYTVSSTRTSNYCQDVNPKVGDPIPVLFDIRPAKIILNFDSYYGYRILPAPDAPGGFRLVQQG